ncbi:protein of unknown function DUF129 [Thalassoporum mexicanum PCC 7367]|uniref:hypothetical protein n=1 Tax=Thalassoporum mexicanum TaxID=3457544 RepID=UPI00029FA435|nr:hypothetical protein [Pseudanabaena sp. PCC 7367]AFY71140.1 protein of unknown function DUF129 [Pseudanabaena sp. PCC 7367]
MPSQHLELSAIANLFTPSIAQLSAPSGSLIWLIWFGYGLVFLIALLILFFVLFEWQYLSRQGNLLEVSNINWQIDEYKPKFYQLRGEYAATNYTKNLDVFLIEARAEVTLMSKDNLAEVKQDVVIRSRHEGVESRNDGYWEAYIVKAGYTTAFDILINLEGRNLRTLDCAWVRLHYVIYGPEGRLQRVDHSFVPLKFPDANEPERWHPTQSADVMAVRTHLLSPLDTPVEVIRRYVLDHAQPGDIVTIGETPLAIMQNRLRHPSDVRPGALAKRLCYYFLPTSSLATACGLQVLVDEVGAWRVAFAFVLGAIARILLRIRGGFYMLAGKQAKLIDDVTGTLPPYDQFIVMGPDDPQAIVNEILEETGLEAAIVDVNDLRAVAILAATPGVSQELLNQALLHNPAGNAAEQTPVVLIRPNYDYGSGELNE